MKNKKDKETKKANVDPSGVTDGEQSAEAGSTAADGGAKKERDVRSMQKRGIIIAFAVMAAIVVVWYVVIPAVGALIQKSKKKGETSDYMDHVVSYIFYPANYSEDIYADEEYMKKERHISYKNGNDTYIIYDEDYAQYGRPIVFFSEYFDTVINGRYEEYDKYFTEHYFENQTNKEKFTPQKIYDIQLEILSSRPGDGFTTHVFSVQFKIRRNNGTFRNDIDSDRARAVFYELIEDENGKVLINYIGAKRPDPNSD